MPPAPVFARLGGRTRLLYLLRHFYADVRQHQEIGPIFAAQAQELIALAELIGVRLRQIVARPTAPGP